MDWEPGIVLDNGSGSVKVGIAGEERPRSAVATVVGRPRHVRVMEGGALEGKECVSGSEAIRHRGILRLSWPMERGVVRDWADLERVWESGLFGEAGGAGEEGGGRAGSEEGWWEWVQKGGGCGLSAGKLGRRPLLVCGGLEGGVGAMEKMLELALEKFGFSGMYALPSSLCALYASGKVTGTILEAGHSNMKAMAIYEGYSLTHDHSPSPTPHTPFSSPLGGQDVANHLSSLLRGAGVPIDTSADAFTSLLTSARSTFVALDPAKAESYFLSSKHATSSSSSSSSTTASSTSTSSSSSSSFVLPDGGVVEVGASAFRAAEVLFRPEVAGLDVLGAGALVVGVLEAVPGSLRAELMQHVVLSGGVSETRGFAARLAKDMMHRAPWPGAKLSIKAPKQRWALPWTGASMLASITAFQPYVSNSDLEEHGAENVARNILANKHTLPKPTA